MDERTQNKILYWINFLHIYQPPTQKPDILEKVTDESYSHILDLLDSYPDFKITMNISGSLIELFRDNNFSGILDRFREKISKGQIELTGSAMYHPILPLINKPEVKHQIELNNQIIKDVFGNKINIKGFYFPEMAYSSDVAKIVKDLGFEWVILDEVHSPKKPVDSSIKYEIESCGLNVVFRNRKYSKSFPPKSIIDNKETIKENFLVTAHDGEMYGHWHKDKEGSYEKMFGNKDVINLTVSEYLGELETKELIEPRNANWESTEEELKQGVPYALWNYPDNKIHQELWALAEWVHDLILENSQDPNFKSAKRHYDKGISSCYWWWSSEKKIDAFSPVSWNPTEIERGLDELLRSVRSLDDLGPKSKLKAEKISNKLRNLIWHKHWSKMSKKTDE